jgi:hypothetical protein
MHDHASFLHGQNTANLGNDIAMNVALDRATGNLTQVANERIHSWQQRSAQWENYAHGLEDKLTLRDGQLVATGATKTGHAAAEDELRKALAAVNPNHPLLKPGALDAVKADNARRFAAGLGYTFNPATGGVKRQG